MSYTACISCGEEADSRGCGLPIGDGGEIVGVSHPGPWAGAPACASCYAVHASFTLANDHEAETAIVRAVLAAHITATLELRRKLMQARFDLKLIRGTVTETLESIGEYPALDALADVPVIYLPELLPAQVFKPGTRVSVAGVVYRWARDVWQKEPT